MSDLIKNEPDKDDLFVITDSAAAFAYTCTEKAACAGTGHIGSDGGSRQEPLYVIEDIEYMPLFRIHRMWQRYHGIPWTIAETPRLVIREQTVDDVNELYGLYADKEIVKYTEDLYEDPDDEKEYMRQYIDNQYRFFEYGIWAVTLKDQGTLIGRAGISLREGYDIPEIGYVIGKDYQGRGYAKEALEAILKYAADELEMNRFIAFTKEKNVPSVKLLKSLGFTHRRDELIKGGRHSMYFLTKCQ
ncbi:MAG: GNAT family N-acetyltransferase [Lachnospiraceae bacterium]|nr:GNAT family N-acetyltransferase [Lachnospiraceae bacterium]